MKKISKGSCMTASHRLFKDKAKNHVDDPQVNLSLMVMVYYRVAVMNHSQPIFVDYCSSVRTKMMPLVY
jgi:hypothetical protein